MYEVYISTEGKKKTYLVFDPNVNWDEVKKTAKKFFRVSEQHIDSDACWILNDELYFKNPNKKGSKKKIAVYWHK